MAADRAVDASEKKPIIMLTGASAGIGSALARELARRRRAGAIVLTARRATDSTSSRRN